MEILAEALDHAMHEGYVRTFVDSGAPMAALLRQAAARGITPAYVTRLLSAFVQDPEPDAGSQAASPGLVEPLTEREIEVLDLLAAGHTNREIAQKLYLSVNTVKTHLKHIYGKLDVGNRRDATATGHRLGLID
jgi:LuxR family maltose regulon positive regulatory protein